MNCNCMGGPNCCRNAYREPMFYPEIRPKYVDPIGMRRDRYHPSLEEYIQAIEIVRKLKAAGCEIDI